MKTFKGLQDRIEIAIGIWLLASPWLLGHAAPFAAAATISTIVGVGVLIVSIDDLHFPNALEEWMDVLFGVALMVSPWIAYYSNDKTATVNAVICGVLIAGLASWSLTQPKEPPGESDTQTPHHA